MSILLRIGAVRGNTHCVDLQNSGQDAASSDTDAHDIPVPEEVFRRPPQTYPGCFGLPYQDHNYGAPPPMSPTPPKSPPPPAPKVNRAVPLEEEVKVPVVSNEEEVVEDSVTRCICGYLHDDGYMICCDKCSVWQHIDCMEIDRNNIPENYCCELCEPRQLDADRAKMIQQRKRQEIDTSATDTDPEEPANALASLGRKPVPPKPKGSKQRRVSKAGTRLLKSGKLAKSQLLKRDKKLKLTKKEKENVKDISKKLKVVKTGVGKQKKLKKKLNTALAQNKADVWSALSSPFCSVDEIQENDCSPEILEFLSHVKTNGIHSPHSIGVFPEELLVRLYQVSDIKNHKGLEATDLIVPGRAVIEYKGKVMLRQHYQPDPFLCQSQPYVLYYSKFEGLDLCIDASAFGGDARFIRRSCAPNSEMCHIIDNGNLHFIVQAKKEIAKGSEITIPFDFSYQDSVPAVECACGKGNCLVTKQLKKVKVAQKSPEKPKRKRQASGEGRVRRNSQSKASVSKAPCGSKSPVKSSPVKSPAAVTPISFSLEECSVSVDTTAAMDILPAVSPPARTSGNSRRSSRAASDGKEEREVREVKPSRPAPSKERECEVLVKVTPVSDCDDHVDVQCPLGESSAQQPVSESEEADSAGECPKKMTREERKMQAIMKAFEKMAKREERRKEALARLDTKKVDVKDELDDRCLAVETSACNTSISSEDRTCEQQLPLLPEVKPFSPEADSKVSIKLEEPPPPAIDSPIKSARHRRMKRKRRSSRVMSALEPLYSSPVKIIPETVTSGGEDVKVKEEPVEQHHIQCLPTPVTPSVDLDVSQPDLSESYMFKKKKYRVTEWSTPRCPDLRADSLEEPGGGGGGGGGVEEMFVAYTPGPRSTMDPIMRRNSTSATYGRPQDGAGGNAKKRWLRQAMHERGPLRVETMTSTPTPNGSTSPAQPNTPVAPGPPATSTSTTPSLPSPTGSPSDFVTPLKKRRLAPEFLPSLTLASAVAASSCETTAIVSSEVSGIFPTTSTPASTTDTPSLSQARNALPSDRGDRMPMKAIRLFGKSRNGLVGSSSALAQRPDASPPPSSAVCRLWPDSRPAGDASGECVGSHHRPAAMATNTTTTRVRGGHSDNQSVEVSHSPSLPASSASAACLVNNSDSGIEMPLVDSSGAPLDADLPEAAPRLLAAGGACALQDNRVCMRRRANSEQQSADSERQRPDSEQHSANSEQHNADSERQSVDSERQRTPTHSVAVIAACSSASRAAGSACSSRDQDQDVSESRMGVEEEGMEVEDEGNEASGSVSGSEEPGNRVSGTAPLPAGDCQVNSSQDSPSSARRLPRPSCSREAECNNAAQSPPHPTPRRTSGGSWRGSAGCSGEGDSGAVSSALDNSVRVRDRTGVSSAQDNSARDRTGVSSALDNSVGDRDRTGVSSALDNRTRVSSALDNRGGVSSALNIWTGDRDRTGVSSAHDNRTGVSSAQDNRGGVSSAQDNRGGVSSAQDNSARDRTGVSSAMDNRHRGGVSSAMDNSAGDRGRGGVSSAMDTRQRGGVSSAMDNSARDRGREGVSSAMDTSAGDRDRGGVSSAQDTAAVSSFLSMRDCDVDCGPSSSTQALGSRQSGSENVVSNSCSSQSLRSRRMEAEESVCNSSSAGSLCGRTGRDAGEDSVCNSSDVTGSEAVVQAVCENNVDSTTQTRRGFLRSVLNRCDTADSPAGSQAGSQESCCDSNSDDRALSSGSQGEGGGGSVSSSGPADSQCDGSPDTGQRGGRASSGVVSSSQLTSSSSRGDSGLSSVAAMPSSSAVSGGADPADLPGPSQSTPPASSSPSVSNSFSPVVDSASLNPSVTSASVTSGAASSALRDEGRESDSVGTSGQSSVGEGEGEIAVSSASLQPSPEGEGEVSVSSAAAGLEGGDERLAVNGDMSAGGLVTNFSEDSDSGSTHNPCTAVSSSEAQAAPATKRKVSLSEYRNRRKDRVGCAASTSSSTSPKSSDQTCSRRATVDSSISLAPLPLFEPITISRESRESRDLKEPEKEKPMSLSDRLRIEFGLEMANEEDKGNSTGHRKPSNDIPPPPPLPPNGMLGGVGVRRPTSSASRAGWTENEDEGRAGLSFAGKIPSASATSMVGSNAAFPSTSSGVKHGGGGGPSSLAPGYTWLAKLHSQATAPTSHPQHSPALFPPTVAHQPPFIGAAAGVPHLPNGSQSHGPPASFSTGAVYPSPPPPQPPHNFTATVVAASAVSLRQQPPPPPPPPPSTAYSPFVAQSRTPSSLLLPQAAGGALVGRGRSGSLSQAQLSPVGNGAGRSRHASADPSSNHHPGRRHHFDQYMHAQTVKQKGAYGPSPTVKRH